MCACSDREYTLKLCLLRCSAENVCVWRLSQQWRFVANYPPPADLIASITFTLTCRTATRSLSSTVSPFNSVSLAKLQSLSAAPLARSGVVMLSRRDGIDRNIEVRIKQIQLEQAGCSRA